MNEVRNTIFDMGPLKIPGPDRFNAHFYQQGWGGESLKRMMHEVFTSARVSEELNTTLICLIPKVNSLDYKP